ncbi:MAG: sugar phosphate isomerase/epimerase family protein [Verrucomicrobiales bacterium]
MIILTGIADEAGRDIDTQIAAHRELGWEAIELRLVDGKNVCGDLSDEDFARAADRIEEAGLRVTGFASAIGNWSRRIDEDFQRDLDELRCAIPRMQRLGARFIRTMSWVGEGVAEGEWRDEALRRYRELVELAADGGIFLAHENCTGWGGLSGRHMRELIETIDSPHLVVLFDVGNTISHGYEPWPFYREIKDLIRYVHVKDCRVNPEGGRSALYTYPGEGDACVREILADLLGDGYEGVVSIEPHVASIVHLGESQASPEEVYGSYLRYARQTGDLLDGITGGTPT